MAANQPAADDPLLTQYLATLAGNAATTVDAYQRVLRQFLIWLGHRPGGGTTFQPDAFTRTAVECYLADLESAGRSLSHRARVKV